MAKKNYNKMYDEAKEDVKIETESFVEEASAEVETVIEETVVEAPAPEFKKGVVTNCTKLNVRKAPKTNAEIIGTLDVNATVTIYDEVGEFYKVGPCDEYCMKKYISVK